MLNWICSFTGVSRQIQRMGYSSDKYSNRRRVQKGGRRSSTQTVEVQRGGGGSAMWSPQ